MYFFKNFLLRKNFHIEILRTYFNLSPQDLKKKLTLFYDMFLELSTRNPSNLWVNKKFYVLRIYFFFHS